jgi:hypothetical protein
VSNDGANSKKGEESDAHKFSADLWHYLIAGFVIHRGLRPGSRA